MSIWNFLWKPISLTQIFQNLLSWEAHGIEKLLLYFFQKWTLSWTNVYNFWGFFPGSYFEFWKWIFGLSLIISVAIFVFKNWQTLLNTLQSKNNISVMDIITSAFFIPAGYSLGFGITGVYGMSLGLQTLANVRSLSSIATSNITTRHQFFESTLQDMGNGILLALVGTVVLLALIITAFLLVFDYVLTDMNFWLFGIMSPIIFCFSPVLGDYPKTFMQRMILIPIEQFIRIFIVIVVTLIPLNFTGMVFTLGLLAFARHPLKLFGTSSSSDAPLFASTAIVMNSLVSTLQMAGNISSVMKGAKK